MPSLLRVDTDALAAADAQLTDAAARAAAELRSLRGAAATLLSSWRGAGGAHARAAWDDWHAGALELLAALDDLARSLGASGLDYATTEDAVRSALVTP